MVKGTTRQVVVVKGPDPKLFEQAIFLVRDEALSHGGVTEEALLKEAKQVCAHPRNQLPVFHRLLWFISGAATTTILAILVAWIR